MPEVSRYDLEIWKFKGEISAYDSQSHAVATATLAAPPTNFRNRVIKVDASFSTSTVSGLLTLKSGSTTIAVKYIHGAGALDCPEWGRPANATAEDMSAVLVDGGVGVVGTVAIVGFYCPE